MSRRGGRRTGCFKVRWGRTRSAVFGIDVRARSGVVVVAVVGVRGRRAKDGDVGLHFFDGLVLVENVGVLGLDVLLDLE